MEVLGVKKNNVIIVKDLNFIKTKCPSCEKDLRANYEIFVDDMSNNYSEWIGQLLMCDKCGEIFRIDSIEIN